MSEKKYYTPSIEEFHVGFEYEISYDGETYQSKVVDDSDELHRIKTAIESLWVRVKHLDREDIESLGWAFFQKDHFGHDEFVFKTTVPDSMDSPEATYRTIQLS